jgi:hypothetical protein
LKQMGLEQVDEHVGRVQGSLLNLSAVMDV